MKLTNSQVKTIDFYKNKSDIFYNILSINQGNDKVVTIETDKFIYYIGRLGGLSSELKTN
jgi:hypothetical protein